ncbi:capsule synthesis protein PGA_cap [Kushneria sinocarnis]|uniref:Capsule synthesis protein PGA_cap n=1 Tax=Kushneria sinocarnis TaxID=595502 RepID=A0A420WW89_9GAMM|nr:CapA family protein [Kushneria sinocarnis]RKR03388.1 capsule synthesis protein PGA_cap [Kushneria sinocarnis]
MPELFVCGDVVNAHHQGQPLCDPALSEQIRAADYAICNLEAPVSGHGQPLRKSGPHLNQPAGVLSRLREEGFDLMLLANNHIMDYGEPALQATLEEIRRLELDSLGAGPDADSAYRPLIRRVGDVTVGMLNACEAQFGVLDFNTPSDQAGYAWLNHPRFDRALLALKRACDFVLVFAHAGMEHYSIPQQEWRERYRHLCALGADAVIACHPHVPQGWERHGDSLIVYSLGNFHFNSLGTQTGDRHHSYALRLQLERGAPIGFTPVFHHNRDGVVVLSEETERIDLDELCRQLNADEYQRRHEAMSLEVYRTVIRGQLTRSLLALPSDGTLRGTLKETAATLLGRRRGFDRTTQQLHLTRNETYYYATRHALELLSRSGQPAR